MSKLKGKKPGKPRGLVHPQATGGAVARQRPPARRWLVRCFAVVCLVGAAVTTYLLMENVLWPRIPAALVGEWRVEGGPTDGLMLEFHADGEFHARLMRDGQRGAVHARAEVESDRLYITSVDGDTGREVTKTHIIRKLTENQLVLEDPTGIVSTLVRVP